MPWSRHTDPPRPGVEPGSLPSRSEAGGPRLAAEILDPVLVPLGFAPGQVGVEGDGGQVIFCRGDVGSVDGGCVDLVLDIERATEWRITDVRYWGFPSDRWHFDFDRGANLADQLSGLARSLPHDLG